MQLIAIKPLIKLREWKQQQLSSLDQIEKNSVIPILINYQHLIPNKIHPIFKIRNNRETFVKRYFVYILASQRNGTFISLYIMKKIKPLLKWLVVKDD